jgi:hypothetical protein
MNNMRLSNIVGAWLEERKWQERPQINRAEQTSSTQFYCMAGDFSLECFLDVVEQAGVCKLFMYYLESKAPQTRFHEVLAYINKTNCGLEVGALQFVEHEQSLRYYASLDVENAAFEGQHISNLLDEGLRTMAAILPEYMALCFGDGAVEDAIRMDDQMNDQSF